MNFTSLRPSPKMPVAFMGHGSPLFAITDNPFRKGWIEWGKHFGNAAQTGRTGLFPQPQLILCISAHWLTHGWWVTGMARPKTIHDFGGFPKRLFEQQYPAPGHPEAAQEIAQYLGIKTDGSATDAGQWGLDHGAWSVLMNLFPSATIPVIQMSLNADASASDHFEFAKKLKVLRHFGVFIMGSGQMVHNLGRIEPAELFDESPMTMKPSVQGSVGERLGTKSPEGYGWALQFDAWVKETIQSGALSRLAQFEALGVLAQMAHPTHEHYWPLLYAAACAEPGEPVQFLNERVHQGSLAMRCALWADGQ